MARNALLTIQRLLLRSKTVHLATVQPAQWIAVQDRAFRCCPDCKFAFCKRPSTIIRSFLLLSRPRNGQQYKNAHSTAVQTAQCTAFQGYSHGSGPGPRIQMLSRLHICLLQKAIIIRSISLLSISRNGQQSKTAHSTTAQTAQWTAFQDCAFCNCQHAQWTLVQDSAFDCCPVRAIGLQSWTAQWVVVQDCAMDCSP